MWPYFVKVNRGSGTDEIPEGAALSGRSAARLHVPMINPAAIVAALGFAIPEAHRTTSARTWRTSRRRGRSDRSQLQARPAP